LRAATRSARCSTMRARSARTTRSACSGNAKEKGLRFGDAAIALGLVTREEIERVVRVAVRIPLRYARGELGVA
jgi:hypothetical protein